MPKNYEDDDWELKFKKWNGERKPKIKSLMIEPVITQNESVVYKRKEKKKPKLMQSEISAIESTIRKKLDLEHRPRLKMALMIIAYAIPAILLLVLFSLIFKPAYASDNLHYNLQIGSEKDMDPRNVLYLENSKALSPRVIYGAQTYRDIVKTVPFTLVFKSPVSITRDRKPVLDLSFIGKNSSVYINEELIFPNLDQYTLHSESSDYYIYRRKEIYLEPVSYSGSEKPTELLKTHYGGASFYPSGNEPVNISVIDYRSRDTVINNTFRDGLTLLVYSEGNLKLDFSKVDMNLYEGKDEYEMTISDFNNNVIQRSILEDDGNEVGTANASLKEQNFNFNVSDTKGAYYIRITRSRNNTDSDSTIKNIKVNSNKVMLYRDFVVLDPISLYFKNNFRSNVDFHYWHSGKDQNITLDGHEIYLDKNYKGVTYTHAFEIGEHFISIEKGDISIRQPLFVALSEENWFEVPLVGQHFPDEPIFIIISKKKLIITDKGFVIFKNMTHENHQRFEIRTSNKDKLKISEATVEIR